MDRRKKIDIANIEQPTFADCFLLFGNGLCIVVCAFVGKRSGGWLDKQRCGGARGDFGRFSFVRRGRLCGRG